MKVLVCGGRDYRSRRTVYRVLDDLAPSIVINGGATGADQLSAEWAIERGVKLVQFFAEWKRYGSSAGPRRNALMLSSSQPDLVVAFHGGRGTADMVRRAESFGVAVRKIE